MENWQIGIFVFIICIGLYFIKDRHFSKTDSLLMDMVDPEQYIIKLEKEIKINTNEKFIKMLNVNISTGLFLRGKFDEAINLLKTIDIGYLNKDFKRVYYNNYILCLLQLERLDEAKEFKETKMEILQEKSRNDRVNISVQRVLAIYDFYFNENTTQCKKTFEYLIEINKINLYTVTLSYYLGLILIKEGKVREARPYFEMVQRIGSKTFYAEKIKGLI